MSRDDEFLDNLIDGALESYVESEPRAGLEYRLLARASSQALARAWRPAWAWAAALGIALAAIPMGLRLMRTERPGTSAMENLPPAPAIVATNAGGEQRELPHSKATGRQSAGSRAASARVHSLVGGERYFADAPIVLKPIRMEPIELGR